MASEWCKFVPPAFFLITGTLIMEVAVFGVNRLDRTLNQIHAAATRDTLGILSVIVRLMVIHGLSMDSLKLLLLILFFWVVSSVPGHMINRLEVAINENLTDPPTINTDEQSKKKEESE